MPTRTFFNLPEEKRETIVKIAIAETTAGNTYNETLIAAARARGEVFAVNPAISPGGRAIEARILLDPETTENLRHGEQVLTWIAVEEDPNAIVVPLNAVVYRDQISYVFVVNVGIKRTASWRERRADSD